MDAFTEKVLAAPWASCRGRQGRTRMQPRSSRSSGHQEPSWWPSAERHAWKSITALRAMLSAAICCRHSAERTCGYTRPPHRRPRSPAYSEHQIHGSPSCRGLRTLSGRQSRLWLSFLTSLCSYAIPRLCPQYAMNTGCLGIDRTKLIRNWAADSDCHQAAFSAPRRRIGRMVLWRVQMGIGARKGRHLVARRHQSTN